MPEILSSDGVSLSFDDEGEGPPIVLVHGFAASRTITWRNTLWYDKLRKAGRRVVALDCRGHGLSGKPHVPEDYQDARMARDIVDVLDSLSLSEADLMGYSMGGFIAIQAMHDFAPRLSRVVLAGIGDNYFHFWEKRSDAIAEGMVAQDAAAITDPTAREFRAFAERAGNDLLALAACVRRPRLTLDKPALKSIAHRVLIVCGADDTTSGDPGSLAEALGSARAIRVPGRNHHSAVGDKLYKSEVIFFLNEN